MFKFIKFFISKFNSSRYIIKGKCKCCGECCRNIVFLIGENYIQSPEQFELMKRWDKKYNHFFISGKNEKGALLFTCKSLGDDNRCKDYFFRSIYCRKYPKLDKKIILGGYETFDKCGYEFVIDKKFSEYLK